MIEVIFGNGKCNDTIHPNKFIVDTDMKLKPTRHDICANFIVRPI